MWKKKNGLFQLWEQIERTFDKNAIIKHSYTALQLILLLTDEPCRIMRTNGKSSSIMRAIVDWWMISKWKVSRRRVKVKTSQPKVASTQVYLYLLRTNQCRIRTSGYINFRRSQGKEKGSGPDHWQNRARNIAKLFGNNIRWLVVGGWQLSTAQLSYTFVYFSYLVLTSSRWLPGGNTHTWTDYIYNGIGRVNSCNSWHRHWMEVKLTTRPQLLQNNKNCSCHATFRWSWACAVFCIPTYIGVAGVRMAIHNAKVMMLLTCSYLLKCIAVGHVFNGGVVWLWL